MLIQVVYKNGKCDMVKDFFLDNLIAGDFLCHFRRRGGWIDVDRDPVRRPAGINSSHAGPERRSSPPPRPLDILVKIDGREYRPSFAGCRIHDRSDRR